MPQKKITCTVCEKEVGVREVVRVYGEGPLTLGCCSAQCYTKKLKLNSSKCPQCGSDSGKDCQCIARERL